MPRQKIMKLDDVIAAVEDEIGSFNPGEASGLFFRGRDEVRVIGFDVDPSRSTIEKGIKQGADLIVTHHLASWSPISRPAASVSINETLKQLGAADTSLACYHLVWDFSRNDGNFLHLAKLLGLTNLSWITKYEKIDGVTVVGELPQEQNIVTLPEYIQSRFQHKPEIKVYTNNPAPFKKIAISTGGGVKDFLLEDIFRNGITTYVTGEPSHSGIRAAKDLGINIVCMGHYWTEALGMRNLMGKVQAKLGSDIKTLFVDDPGGC